MMYYIEKPNTWRAANKKCAEVQEFVDKFQHCLIADELSRDAMVAEIRLKVAELNDAYPRTKKLVVHYDFDDCVSCCPEGRSADYEYVFIIKIMPIRKHYQFAEATEGMLEPCKI